MNERVHVPQFWYDSLLNELKFNDFTVFSYHMHCIFLFSAM